VTSNLLAGRLVAVMGGVLLVASLLFATTRSSETPWSGDAAQPVQPAAATLITSGELLRDDFAHDPIGANPPGGWTIEDGGWDGVVADAGRVVRHASGQSGHLTTGSAQWTDYSVSVRLRPGPLATGSAGVAARYHNRGNYYACDVYHDGAVRLWRVQAGSMTLLDVRRVEVASNRFHDVRLAVHGSNLSCILDDTAMLRAVDSSLASGQIALVCNGDMTAEFGDVRVAT
jgi:hypothetical protein